MKKDISENKEDNVTHKKKVNIFKLLFRIISIIIILVCIVKLVLWQIENIKNSNIQEELSSYVNINETDNIEITTDDDSLATSLSFSSLDVDFSSLKKLNSNVVAWIYIPNTNINYSIVQGNNNSFYLNHNFNNKKNSAGWIFADYTNNFEKLDQNTVIYGHNRRNGTMFSNLTYLLDPTWYNDETNKYFNFVTENQSYIAQIFSVYKVSSEEVILPTNFNSTSDFYYNVDSWIDNSVYNFNVSVNNPNENIITLYTCDNNTKYRVIVHAKLLKIKD